MELRHNLNEFNSRRNGLNEILNRTRVIRNYNLESIRPQTANMFKVENQKVKRGRSIGDILFLASEALGLAACAGVVAYTLLKTPISNALDELKLRQTYNQAMEQYGDTNCDGFLSAQENRELFQNIFPKTGINFGSGGATYSDGRQVPTSELTKIVRDYIDNPLGGRK